MPTLNTSVSFFLDASRPNDDGKCLIKLNLYHKPNKKRYATRFHATKAEWEKINSPNLRDEELKKVKKGLADILAKAEKVIARLEPFSFVAFEEAFFDKTAGRHSTALKAWFDNYIDLLKAKGQNRHCSFLQNHAQFYRGLPQTPQPARCNASLSARL